MQLLARSAALELHRHLTHVVIGRQNFELENAETPDDREAIARHCDLVEIPAIEGSGGWTRHELLVPREEDFERALARARKIGKEGEVLAVLAGRDRGFRRDL